MHARVERVITETQTLFFLHEFNTSGLPYDIYTPGCLRADVQLLTIWLHNNAVSTEDVTGVKRGGKMNMIDEYEVFRRRGCGLFCGLMSAFTWRHRKQRKASTGIDNDPADRRTGCPLPPFTKTQIHSFTAAVMCSVQVLMVFIRLTSDCCDSPLQLVTVSYFHIHPQSLCFTYLCLA